MRKILSIASFIFALLVLQVASAQPTLNAPVAGATNLSTSFTIAIVKYPGATSYDIELSIDGSFTGTYPNYQAQLSGGRSFSVSGLRYGQTYFLRWRANNSGYGNTTIATAGLPIPTLNTPIIGATNLALTFNIGISLVGAASTYDIELSKDGSFTGSAPNYQSSINSTSRTLNIVGLSYGQTYQIRWRARSELGNSAYGITTISTAPLGIPALSTPTAGAINLGISFNIGISAISGSSGYDIELSRDGSFTGTYPDYQSSINSMNRTLAISGLSYATSYSIRWRARSASGNSQYGGTVVTTAALPVPTLVSPTAGDVNLNPAFTISIGNVGGATSYDIEISKDGSFSGTSPDYQASINTTNRTFNVQGLHYGQAYQLRYRARSAGGNSQYGITTVSVRSLGEITVGNLVTGTYLNSETIALTPSSNGVSASSYDWQFDTSMAFNSSALITANTLVPNYTYNRNNFKSGAKYYVRVRMNTASQGSSGYSSGENLKEFYSSLHTATIVNPIVESVLNELGAKLSCNLITNATGYELQYSKSPDFSNSTIVVPAPYYDPGKFSPVGSVIEMAYVLNDLDPYTNYYVRARAYNANQSSEFGSSISFNTGGAYIQFNKPLTGTTDVSSNVTFAIAFYGGTFDQYEILYSTTPDFVNPGSVFTPARTVTVPLKENTTYYCKINYQRHGVWYSSISPAISFTTYIENANVKGLKFAYPTDGTAEMNTNFYASIASFVADSFAVEYSKNADFTSSITTAASKSRVIPISGLDSGAVYYARVKAKKNGGWYTAALSTISFTTKALGVRIGLFSQDENLNTEDINVYPNPYMNSFTIEYANEVKVRIFNSSGHMVSEFSGFPGGDYGQDLNPGLYTVEIETIEGNRYTKKIIKQ